MKESLKQRNLGVRPNRIVFNTYSMVGLVYCSLFTWIFYTVSPSPFLAIVHMSAFLTFLTNYIVLARTRNFERAAKIFLVTGLAVIAALFATGGWEKTGYLWPLVYLVFVFFISDRDTWRWVTYLYITCVLVILLNLFHAIHQPYTPVEVTSFFAAMGVITLFIYYFQKALNNYQAFLSFTRNLFEASVDPFFTMDEYGRITDANKVMEEITGLPLDKIIGSKFENYATNPEKASDICAQVLKNGSVRNCPLDILHCQGGVTNILLNVTLHSDKILGLVILFAIARDISGQKKAETRLKELTEDLERQVKQKTAELAAVFERVTVPFIALDYNWHCTYINSRAEKVLNTTAEQLQGKDIREEFPQGASPILNKYQKAFNEQRFIHSEDYSAYSDRWFESDIYPSRDGLSIFFNEITHQKRTELALKNSQKKTQLIIDSALDAIICIDKKSRIIEWNPRAEYVFGWTKSEILGRTVTETIIPEPYRKKHEEGMDHLLRTGEGPLLNIFFELSALRRDGTSFPIEMTIAPILQDDDQFFCAFVRDITRRKDAETHLQELNQTLKEQAEALAASNTGLEQFAFLASHDLQEPLRTISSFIQLLRNRYKDKFEHTGQIALDLIFESSERMKTLIKDLLEYSRIGNNRQLINIDCNVLLHHVLVDLAKMIVDSGANIQPDILPVISGYPTELKLLFQNLIGNALKFTAKDTSPEITIAARQKDGFWEFSFRDNGIGISAKEHQKIFDIFKRLHSRSEYEGSGIGLAHCRKIVELHGGKIWVESSPGRGSTFYFTIPDTPAANGSPRSPLIRQT